MKLYKHYPVKQLLLAGLVLFLGACNRSEVSEEEKGEPIAVKFDLSAVSTRADGNALTDIMKEGNTFQVFAFNQGSDVATTAPLASETYTTVADGTAIGNMKLFRGEYDLYFASFNATGQSPMLDAVGGTITVDNEKDFMNTSLKGISIQPDGANTGLTLPLTSPFNRMGAEVTMEVKAAPTLQPVPITGMKVNYIELKGASSPIKWKLGDVSWTIAGRTFNQNITFTEFTGNESNYNVGYKCIPKVFLPTDGTAQLEFLINMTVNGKERNYAAILQKSLLQGMGYNFSFELTFYGDIALTDLTLAVKEYNRVNLSTDEIGGDK